MVFGLLSFFLRLLLWLLTLAGGVATFRARPYAPWKELLSLMRKVPGSLSFRAAMAATKQINIKIISNQTVGSCQTCKELTLLSRDAGLVPEPGTVLDKFNADPVSGLGLVTRHVLILACRGCNFPDGGREGDVVMMLVVAVGGSGVVLLLW